ncbi:MAG TPA: methionine--tRNA ligase [Ktedonobacterales bacterium]|nr:methionine--tRNA ligase [Ktedonobacterales bacterium]
MAQHDDTIQRPRWYVTTAIPYVNARPHIGHALEFTLTDALARYHRQRGEQVFFLTGTDDNSLKNAQAAEKEGIPTADLVARNAEYFAGLRSALDLSYDDFIRTSVDPRHAAGVEKLWRACAENGDIYTRAYQGLYCVGCEQFYTEAELIDGLCPVHRTRPELVEEENYFFRLSRYQQQLDDLIASDTLRIVPTTRKNEVLSFIRSGLQDFSISRSRARARDWGIPVPDDPSQVIYVWFDALANYITALDYANDGPLYQRYWAENPHRVHVIGKDIIRFHAIYWPAMLLSAHVLPPSDILVHGFVTVSGEKMSKSLGNVLDPLTLINAYGTEAVRYFFLRAVPSTDDADFTIERFVRTINADLGDRLGNLLNRTVSMVGRYFAGVVPAPVEGADKDGDADRALREAAAQVEQRVAAAMARYAVHEALAAIWELADAANKYVEETAPWSLAKQRKAGGASGEAAGARLGTVLYSLVEALRLLALHLTPFLPEASATIARQIGLPDEMTAEWRQVTAWGDYRPGTSVAPGPVLFAKHELPAADEE